MDLTLQFPVPALFAKMTFAASTETDSAKTDSSNGFQGDSTKKNYVNGGYKNENDMGDGKYAGDFLVKGAKKGLSGAKDWTGGKVNEAKDWTGGKVNEASDVLTPLVNKGKDLASDAQALGEIGTQALTPLVNQGKGLVSSGAQQLLAKAKARHPFADKIIAWIVEQAGALLYYIILQDQQHRPVHCSS